VAELTVNVPFVVELGLPVTEGAGVVNCAVLSDEGAGVDSAALLVVSAGVLAGYSCGR
jgi:hypothetical protein